MERREAGESKLCLGIYRAHQREWGEMGVAKGVNTSF